MDAIVNMREDGAMSTVRELLDEKEDPLGILKQCGEAMDIEGEKLE